MKAAFLPALAFLLISALPSPGAAESFASWSAKAERARKRQDTASALEAYGNALRLWKQGDGKKAKAKVLASRAALYADAGSREAALKDLSAAAKLDDKNASIFFHKGRIELDLGRSSDAISDFYKATRLNLNYRDAYYYRGLAYERQDDAKFAREDYKTACKLGLKAACSARSRAKAQATAFPGSASNAFEAATPPEPSKRPVVEVKKPKTRRAYKLNWQGCLDGLNACAEAGDSFGDCVKKAPVCERSSAHGCCPQECVKRYNSLVDQGGQSEASAFRDVFDGKAACSQP